MTTVDEKASEASIGSALAQRRGQLKLSRVQAADHIGMSRTTYSSYERDTQRPSVDVFPVLAGFLDVSLEDFLVLYGATSIAAVRPSLERLLAERANSVDRVESAMSPPPSESATVARAGVASPPVLTKTSKSKKKKKGKRGKG